MGLVGSSANTIHASIESMFLTEKCLLDFTVDIAPLLVQDRFYLRTNDIPIVRPSRLVNTTSCQYVLCDFSIEVELLFGGDEFNLFEKLVHDVILYHKKVLGCKDHVYSFSTVVGRAVVSSWSDGVLFLPMRWTTSCLLWRRRRSLRRFFLTTFVLVCFLLACFIINLFGTNLLCCCPSCRILFPSF